MAWKTYYLPRESGGMGIFDCKCQGIDLCAKWIVIALRGLEAWKFLIRNAVSMGFPLNQKTYKGLDFPSLIMILVFIKILGFFVIRSI